MRVPHFPPKLVVGLLLALFVSIALFLRIFFPYHDIFSPEGIKFAGSDPYSNMRLIDNTARNFPHLISFDPYFLFPGGGYIDSPRFFVWLLAGVAWVIGWGSPTPYIIDMVGAYAPAVMGALAVIPVYFIGKRLQNRWSGVLSALLIAVMPGEFFVRSMLGYTDHHIAEVLLTTTAMLFLILAIRAASHRQLTLRHLRPFDWATSRLTLIYALLAGIFLGFYLLTWSGALLFVFIISVYLIIQFISDHLRHKSTDYTGIIGFILFLIAAVIFIPFRHDKVTVIMLLTAPLIPLLLICISRFMTRRRLKPVYFPLAVICLGVLGLAVFYGIDADLFRRAMDMFSIFHPTGSLLYTQEAQSLYTLDISWVLRNFTSSSFVCPVAIGIFIYGFIKQGSADKNLIVVWSLVMLAAFIGQVRFAYYFAVNVALLTGYLAWQIIRWVEPHRLFARFSDTSENKQAETNIAPMPEKPPKRNYLKLVPTVIIIIVLAGTLFVPNIRVAQAQARSEGALLVPSRGWYSALTWLKDNTADPFDNPDYYYRLYQLPSAGEAYQFPESAYGVIAWWDYGYWITRIAHRLPATNPGQPLENTVKVADFFLSQNESSAQAIVLDFNSHYVIVDRSLPVSKFASVIGWAGKEKNEFFEDYALSLPGVSPRLVRYYYPAYYQAMCIRLYNFNGNAVTPRKTTVISFTEKFNAKGKPYKQINSTHSFATYAEAAEYIAGQQSTDCRIVGDSPYNSPIPLEALQDYKPVYASGAGSPQIDMGSASEVKIFEYTRHRKATKPE